MSREAGRWNIDLGVENRWFRKATRAGQPKEGSRMSLPEEVSKKREVTSSPVAEGAQFNGSSACGQLYSIHNVPLEAILEDRCRDSNAFRLYAVPLVPQNFPLG